MSKIEIMYDDGMHTSYASLVEFTQQRHNVMRSPHAPLNTTNLGTAMLGFDTLLYGDTYIGAASSSKEESRNDPLHIGNLTIAENPSVKTMSRFVTANLDGFKASKLTDLHSEISCAAIEGNITTWHAFAAVHHDLYAAIVEISLEQRSTQFKHGVNVQTGIWVPWREDTVEIQKVLDVSAEDQGVQAVAPLECKLACMFAAQAIDSGIDRIYHLAGRDMVRYLRVKETRITALISKLQQRGFLGNLEVVLVPTAGTKIIAKKCHADILNEMWQLSAKRDSISKQQLRYLLRSKAVRQAMISNVNVLDSEAMGGEGIVILEEALRTPLAHVQHRLKSSMMRTT